VLVEGQKIPRILAREREEFPESVVRAAQSVQETGTRFEPYGKFKLQGVVSCPKCDGGMARRFYGASYPVEVDQCKTCNLTWFEMDHLEILQYLTQTGSDLNN
jgi:hypothetical protein